MNRSSLVTVVLTPDDANKVMRSAMKTDKIWNVFAELNRPAIKIVYTEWTDLWLWACFGNHFPLMECLLNEPRVDPAAQRQAVLRCVARSCHGADMMRRLLRDPRLVPCAHESDVLLEAIEYDNDVVMAVLLEHTHESRVRPCAQESAALKLALEYGRMKILRLLLADTSRDHVRPSDVSFYAIACAREDCARLFLEDGRWLSFVWQADGKPAYNASGVDKLRKRMWRNRTDPYAENIQDMVSRMLSSETLSKLGLVRIPFSQGSLWLPLQQEVRQWETVQRRSAPVEVDDSAVLALMQSLMPVEALARQGLGHLRLSVNSCWHSLQQEVLAWQALEADKKKEEGMAGPENKEGKRVSQGQLLAQRS